MEERRVVSALQETFVRKISELSEVVAKLNVNMEVHKEMMSEIKQNQKEARQVAIATEANNIKIQEAIRSVQEVKDHHNNCGIRDIEREVSSLKTRQNTIFKIIGGIGAGLFPIIAALVSLFNK